MPFDKFGRRTLTVRTGQVELRPVQRIVCATVAIIGAKTWADLEPEVRCDRHVSFVEQAVQVGTQKDAISDIVRAVLRVRANVRGF